MTSSLLRIFPLVLLVGAATGCGDEPPDEVPADAGVQPEVPVVPPRVATELGKGDGSPSSVELTVVATFDSGLRRPRDLDFNPMRPDELWVVNHDDDSMVIVFDASQATRTSEKRVDAAASHFMPFPSSIAFGAHETTIGHEGTFATCQESRNTYGGLGEPNDFMGPALWSSNLTVFAKQDPEGLGSHLDMLHGSPNCMGVAHEKNNVYWAFGGKSHSGGSQAPAPAIVRYDFGHDHGVGKDDHSDGTLHQYLTNEVQSVPGIPSHMVFDAEDSLLYIADTGNARVIALDTTSGTQGQALVGQEPLVAYYKMVDSYLLEIVPGGTLTAPSGIARKGDYLYVSDNATGKISAFTLEGELVNALDTGLGAGTLAGISFGPDGKLYLVDMLGNQVLRIDPK